MATKKSIKAGVNAYLKSKSELTDLVSSRIYHRDAPQNPTYPMLVYHLIADPPLEHTHDGRVGPWRALIQIDGYAETVAAVENLMLQVSDVMAGFSGTMGTFTVGAVFDDGPNPDKSFRDDKTLKWIEGRSADYSVLYHRT